MRIAQSPRVNVGNTPIYISTVIYNEKKTCELDTECYQLLIEYFVKSKKLLF